MSEANDGRGLLAYLYEPHSDRAVNLIRPLRGHLLLNQEKGPGVCWDRGWDDTHAFAQPRQ